ncbi:MAG: hypothetical protein Q4F95_06385 [Oscillospiraceae bacterium]|nr:hypothetical protein [Oscillospiraceae bacterium]
MEAIQYKCPNCGGSLEYRADIQKFGCSFCLSEFTEQEIKLICSDNENTDLSLQTESEPHAGDSQNVFESGNIYSCSSCGAQIMSDDNTAATFCVYCHNPVILKGRLSGTYKPSMVIPFSVERENAVSLFRQTIMKKRFVPKDFRSEQTLEKMTGLYVPFWLADCRVRAHLSATGKVTRSWSQGSYRYTNVKEYQVSRGADIRYTGIPADGASKIDDSLMDAIEPYDYSKMQQFSMSYLSGFLADKYDVDKGGVFGRIKEKADKATNEIMDSSVTGYSSVSVHNRSNSIIRTDWNYALLPVWFMTYSYNGKMYEFAVNGQSGVVAGIPPLSVKKLVLYCAAVFAVLTVLLALGGFLLF